MALETKTTIIPIETQQVRSIRKGPSATPLWDLPMPLSATGTGLEAQKMLTSMGLVPALDLVIPSPRLSQSDLYPARHAFSPEHIAALRLLRLAKGYSQRAIVALNDGDEIAADSETQKVQVLLPELFCCRKLGDGFGTLINALISAFESLAGDPMALVQLRAVNHVFALLLDKPFLTTDDADQELEKLEAVDLNPYPAELVDFLSSAESIR